MTTEGVTMPSTQPQIEVRRSATPQGANAGDLLTVEQAAAYLNITEHFVRRLIQERRIPFVKLGYLVRLRRTELDTFINLCEVPQRRRTGNLSRRGSVG